MRKYIDEYEAQHLEHEGAKKSALDVYKAAVKLALDSYETALKSAEKRK